MIPLINVWFESYLWWMSEISFDYVQWKTWTLQKLLQFCGGEDLQQAWRLILDISPEIQDKSLTEDTQNRARMHTHTPARANPHTICTLKSSCVCGLPSLQASLFSAFMIFWFIHDTELWSTTALSFRLDSIISLFSPRETHTVSHTHFLISFDTLW